MANTEKRTLSIETRVQDFMTRNLGVMQRGVQAFARGVSGAFRTVTAHVRPLHLAITGFAAAWGAFKGGKTMLEILDGVDALNKLGDTLGTTVDKMVLLQAAFELNGAGGEKFTAAMRTLGKAVSGVVDKDTGKLVDAFGELGISVGELRRLDAVEIFDRMAKGLERFGSAQERSAALARLFPKDFQALFATLANGQEEFRKLIATAQIFAGTVSEQAAAAADRFGDAMFLLKKAMESIGRDAFVRIAAQFAPAIEKIAFFLAKNRDAIATGLALLIERITKLLAGLASLFIKFVAFVIDGLAPLIAKLREIPIIGKGIAEALGEAFHVPELPGRAAEIQREAGKVAKAILEAQQDLRVADLSEDTRGSLESLIRSKRQEFDALKEAFQREFEEHGGRVVSPAQFEKTAFDSGSLQQLSSFLDRLADFENMEAPPTNLAPVIRALFGDGGTEAAAEEANSFFEGFGDGITKTIEKWTDFAAAGREAATTLLDGGLNGLTDAFADVITGTKSAKEAFRDFAKAMLADLARIIVKLVIMKALSTFLGLEDGGVVPAEEGGVVRGFASGGVNRSGGVARRPTVLFGEGRTAEAFVPLPDNRSIPVTLNGGGGGGNVFNFHVHAADSRDTSRWFQENQSLIQSIVANRLETRNSFRQVVRRAAS